MSLDVFPREISLISAEIARSPTLQLRLKIRNVMSAFAEWFSKQISRRSMLQNRRRQRGELSAAHTTDSQHLEITRRHAVDAFSHENEVRRHAEDKSEMIQGRVSELEMVKSAADRHLKQRNQQPPGQVRTVSARPKEQLRYRSRRCEEAERYHR